MLNRTALTPGEREQLDTEGYVVLLDVFTPQECDELGDEMDTSWEKFRLHEISDSEEGVRFVDNALYYSAKVQDGLLHPLLLDAASQMVGPRLLLNLINGRSPAAGAAGQPLHVLDRRRGRPFDKCNAIWCLDDFTAENGATRVIPGSHLDDTAALARMGDAMDAHPDEVIVEAPRGAVIMHNSHLIHSGRPNASGADRRSIHAAYTHPEIPTHYDWTALPPAIVADLSEQAFDLLGLKEAALDMEGLGARV
ncbi:MULTISPECIES: phytanoyl-CoA dioxygenase family protein [unclassified Streptomyces]|uniref:phytanoyl-CoA dioxygenase family protein n=1 Tax=unclassified Streptomyces TaxID=2593676 RepID=UPI001BE838BE|nr:MULTISPECIES: phytanoyl-CoA dioxygenase family protein [unclassified Streptomyces]MBT2408146.1 phytanoyl-CoA dioxygenase family protein [Streptomyces sp. ISL-21]MBT2456044.1 phytanoyl-CoA dioxygenase family protein [Streptomyces sp. ISL-86]MBT2609296.1 phytanoyl-CoA dioxygenase family protein [Streptomyces sp. ISL-87]